MNSQRLWVCTVVLLASASARTAFAEDYEVRLTRPVAVGQRFEFKATSTMSDHNAASQDGRVLKEQRAAFTTLAEGVLTVKVIDEQKRAIEYAFEVARCQIKPDGGEARDLLPAGTRVAMFRHAGKDVFMVDDKAVIEDVEEVLGGLIELPDSAETDDDVFGTTQRQSVGSSWKINNARLAKMLALLDLEVDTEKVSGTSTLEKVGVVDGVPCMTVKTKAVVSDTSARVPAGLTLESSKVTIDVSGQYPLDTSREMMSNEIGMVFDIGMKATPSSGGPDVKITTKHVMTRRQTFKPLPAASAVQK
ncbi:MAG: hypothetical protein GC159_21600 [Phycisphaera sp.]|nr:hypothetical protein [Phycisphaera sp.]